MSPCQSWSWQSTPLRLNRATIASSTTRLLCEFVPWCSNILGTTLFFVAGFWCAKRQLQRNGFAFAIIFTLGYALIDAATVGFASLFSGKFALFMFIKLIGALAGTALAVRISKRS